MTSALIHSTWIAIDIHAITFDICFSISCLLEIVDQTMNVNVKVEKLPEESSVAARWKELECGPVPSESEQSGSYPNHLLDESTADR